MSEQQSAEASATEATGTTQDPKPTETVEFWKSKAREQESRAKKNAEAAQRLAEIEEASKSEAEKAADKIKQLEAGVSTARIEAFRQAAVKFGGISDEDAELFLTGSDVETLAKQAERLTARSDERKKLGNHVSREGTSTTQPGEDVMRNFTHSLFNRGD